ncbi:MAG: HD domain-containing protein [Bacteroidaceae bacterium]
MNVQTIINKYYPEDNELKRIYLSHSKSVADFALSLVDRNTNLQLDRTFVYEAAMLHDLGIFLTHAPAIYCVGSNPYICHGYLGAELLLKEGYPAHALVSERHTGTGISLAMIRKQHLPLPLRELQPVSNEEQLICFADKFFSKTKLGKMKTQEKIVLSLSKYGQESVDRFLAWNALFLHA